MSWSEDVSETISGVDSFQTESNKRISPSIETIKEFEMTGEQESLNNFPYDPESKDCAGISSCKCLEKAETKSDSTIISPRKAKLLSRAAATQEYIKQHRIPQLMKFLFAKVLADRSPNPQCYLLKLIDKCMYFRAGITPPPVLYSEAHVKAVLKSFDPECRGWLTVNQVRRLYSTLGVQNCTICACEDKILCDVVLEQIMIDQEQDLRDLLSLDLEDSTAKSNSTTFDCNK